MTPDEAALLAALRAAPDDPMPRLVYADWLDDRGRADQAEYLRVLSEVVRLSARLNELAPALPADWLAEVGMGTVLRSYPPDRKIEVISLIRRLTGTGLAEAKGIAESLPQLLPCRASPSEADRIRELFRQVGADVG